MITNRRWLAGFLFSGGMLACNSLVGINDPIEVGTSSGGTANVRRFVGVWSPTGGYLSLSCPVGGGSEDPTQKLTLVAGDSPDTIIVLPGSNPGCSIRASVSGNTATALLGEECTFSDRGVNAFYTYVPETTFTIDATGTNGNVVIHASVEYPAQTCSFEEGSTYRKIPTTGTDGGS